MRRILIAALFAPFAFVVPAHAASGAPAAEKAAPRPLQVDPRSFSAYGDGARGVDRREEQPTAGWRPEGAEWPQLP